MISLRFTLSTFLLFVTATCGPRLASAWSSYPIQQVDQQHITSMIGVPKVHSALFLTPKLFSTTSSRPTLLRPSRRSTQRHVSVKVDADLAEHASVPTDDPPILGLEELSSHHNNNNPWNFLPGNNGDEIDWTKNIVNGLILLVTLGYAAYTILDVDHGMTRGWTQSEIAMRIPLDNWASYETSLAEKPIYTKTLINVVIYLLGDWLSQTVFQKKNVLDFDPWRTLRNGFIGLCFGPLVHQYYQFSDYILPLETGGITNRILKILMDQTIYLTVKCSIYIMAVGLLAGDSFETCQTSVKTRIKGIVLTAWKFWPLVHCITYSVIPARHRILWVNCVDLVWSAILASMSNAKPAATEEEVAAEAAAAVAGDVEPQQQLAVDVSPLQAVFEEAQALLEPLIKTETFAAATSNIELDNFEAPPVLVTEEVVIVDSADDAPPLGNTTFALSH